MGSKSVSTTSAFEASTAAIVMPDEQYAVSQLRTLRKKAEKTGAEIAKELRMWQDSLGHGRFKKNYLLAGWTELSVNHYLSYYQQHPAWYTGPDVVDSKEAAKPQQGAWSVPAPEVIDSKETPSSILWFSHKLENIIDTLDQLLTETKWRKDKDFPQLQQTGARLRVLLGKL